MRTNWIQKHELEIVVSFNQVVPWLVITVNDVQIFNTWKIVESVFYNVSVYHFLVGFFNFHYLFLHLALENQVKIFVRVERLLPSHCLFLFQTFVQKHFKSGKLKNGSIGILLSEVCIVYRITSLSTSQSCRISSIVLNCLN